MIFWEYFNHEFKGIPYFSWSKTFGNKHFLKSYLRLVKKTCRYSLRGNRVFQQAILSHAIFSMGFTLETLPMYYTGWKLKPMIAFNISNYSLQLCITFLMAVAMQNFCRSIENFDDKFLASSSSSTLILNALAELKIEMKTLKKTLSPLLFMIFSSRCLNLITASLSIARPIVRDTGIFKYSFASLIIFNSWDLFYIVIIVDETMESFKSLNDSLR